MKSTSVRILWGLSARHDALFFQAPCVNSKRIGMTKVNGEGFPSLRYGSMRTSFAASVAALSSAGWRED